MQKLNIIGNWRDKCRNTTIAIFVKIDFLERRNSENMHLYITLQRNVHIVE